MSERTLYVEGNQSFLCGNASPSANELVHSSFILIHYIIEMCWKMHFCGSKVSGNINRPPHTLITVDAVSGLVATVEIPSGECWLDAGVRKCNEHKESCVRLGASSNMTFSRAYKMWEVSTRWLNQVKLSITMWHMGI